MTRSAPMRSAGKRVVLGLDGSDSAWLALDHAVGEARRRGAVLEIVHAWPWACLDRLTFGLVTEPRRPPVDIARDLLDLAVTRVAERDPLLRVVPTLTAEDAVPELLRIGRNAALIVVGSRGLGGFKGLLLGSIGLRLAAHTRRPLFVVRGDRLAAAFGPEGHGRVLVAVKSEADLSTVRFAFEEALRRDARLRVLHVWNHARPLTEARTPLSPEVLALWAKQEQDIPLRLVAALRTEFPQVRARAQAVRGAQAAALIEASRAADVIVLAAHRSSTRLGMQLGPVTHAVLHHAHCPVALIPVNR